MAVGASRPGATRSGRRARERARALRRRGGAGSRYGAASAQRERGPAVERALVASTASRASTSWSFRDCISPDKRNRRSKRSTTEQSDRACAAAHRLG